MIIIDTLINSGKIFGLFTICYMIFTNITLYQAKFIKPTFLELLKYNIYLIILIIAGNILVNMSFSIGINKYNLPVWTVNLIYWSAAVLPSLIGTYIWFGQLPNITQIVGIILVLSGIILVVSK